MGAIPVGQAAAKLLDHLFGKVKVIRSNALGNSHGAQAHSFAAIARFRRVLME